MKPLKPSFEKTCVSTFLNVLIINQVRSEGTCLTDYQGLFTCITFSTLLTARNAHFECREKCNWIYFCACQERKKISGS